MNRTRENATCCRRSVHSVNMIAPFLCSVKHMKATKEQPRRTDNAQTQTASVLRQVTPSPPAGISSARISRPFPSLPASITFRSSSPDKRLLYSDATHVSTAKLIKHPAEAIHQESDANKGKNEENSQGKQPGNSRVNSEEKCTWMRRSTIRGGGLKREVDRRHLSPGRPVPHDAVYNDLGRHIDEEECVGRITCSIKPKPDADLRDSNVCHLQDDVVR
jgi:hypothetical protein